ncbi:TPA: hypothetical protein HA324_02110 [Candidatus Thalassarchaeaceae archaeon]|jgi:hypothetical protein|nr:hypothetical protein [Euryarchaeota archaeon]DAC64070.1 MAG TPA: hypothetical protein D7I04_02245 [Candidatus Poseidoniales archaeon]HIH06054.1 hypothetical protein [Candidatus Thalassarchaeaceae archaeon]HII41947.1 hypothetical protein [Candidatus Thalassarchaeaceae archaeon]
MVDGVSVSIMSDAIYFPSLPPESPWEAYLLLLIIPFLLRLILIAPPLIDLVNTYAPPGDRTQHVKWFLGRLKKLPVDGFWKIVMNEILSFILPALIALTARLVINGDIGWKSWEETPDFGIFLLILAGIIWLVVDFGKVTRSRKNIQTIAKYNLTTAKAIVEGAVIGREFLKTVDEFTIPRPWREVIDISEDTDGVHKPEKTNPLQDIITNLLDKGVDMLEEVLIKAKDPASGMIEKIDTEIRERITKQVQASSRSLMRDIVFSIAPIVVLVALQRFIG